MAIDYRNASRSDLNAEWRSISNATGNPSAYRRTNELTHMAGSLDENERVVALSKCKVERKAYVLAVTSNRLLLLRARFLSDVDEKEFYLETIVGTESIHKWLYTTLLIRTPNRTLQIDELTKFAAHFITKKIRENKSTLTNPTTSGIVDHNSEARIDTRRTDNNSRPNLTTVHVVVVALAIGIIGSWMFRNDHETNISTSVGQKVDSTPGAGTPGQNSTTADSTPTPVMQTVRDPEIGSTTGVARPTVDVDQAGAQSTISVTEVNEQWETDSGWGVGNRTSLESVPHVSRAPECDDASILTNKKMTVIGDAVNVRVGPGIEFERVVNQQASDTNSIVYRQIYKPAYVLEKCRKNEWSFVDVQGQILYSGWIDSRFLADYITDSSDKKIYTTADFSFDNKQARKYQNIIVAGVNKIYRENKKCRHVETADYSVTRSKPGQPVFYVMCGTDGGQVFNVFFTESELGVDNQFSNDWVVQIDGRDKSLTMEEKKALSVLICQQHARQIATHPSTVSFPIIGGIERIMDHPNGRITAILRFTARNTFNLELSYRIQCLVDSGGLIDAAVAESAQ